MVFGTKAAYHRQACLSILSLLKQTTEDDKILMLTDAPEYYRFFAETIDVHVIQPLTLQEWKGVHNFFWRVKIQGVSYAHAQYPEKDILYLDTDTFLFGSLNELQQLISSGKNVMHLKEGLLCKLHTKTIKTMWRQLNGKTYQNCLIDKHTSMWNAGAIGFSAAKANTYLVDILAICDQMLADKVRPKLIEQFAFSLRLQQQNLLHPVDHILGHYWGTKAQWNTAIQEFLSTAFMQGQELEDIIGTLDANYWLQLPIYEKRSSLAKKLLGFVTKCFYQPKNVVYFNSKNKL